ncbi:MAG: GEVED domain-containing protein, partial [Thermoguttaceae bacterium]
VQLIINGDNRLEDDENFYVVVDSVTVNGVPWGNFDPLDRGQVGIYNDDGQLDYGDAPASYYTLVADNGPRHVTVPGDTLNVGYYLGAKIDAEADGRPSVAADGDDGFVSDDEDGVSIRSHWLPGGTVQLVVTASMAGYLEGWADFNIDGDFGDRFGNADFGESLVFNGGNSSSILLALGENLLTVPVPADATLGSTYARFRFSRTGGLGYVGSSRSGEVEDYAITITDDRPGVVITPIGTTNDVVEGGLTDSYKVVLTAQPTQTVWVNIAGDADVTTNPMQLKFTPDNWDVAQTVTVVAVDDSIAELPGSNIGWLTHTTQSGDLAYNSLSIPQVRVNVTDNDLAKVQIYRTGGSTRVKEDGTLTDTYEVVLTSMPVGDVTVAVDGGSQLLVSKTAGGVHTATLNLTFTPTNWNTRQVVYVKAVDDSMAEGDPSVPLASREHPALILHSASSSADAMYNSLGGAVDSVSVQIGDNDSPGIEVRGGSSLTVTEGSLTPGSYQIRLLSKPSQNVRVTLQADDQVSVTTASPLIFTPQNWDQYQTVNVVAVDDPVAEASQSGVVSHVVFSDDPFYTGLTLSPVTIGIVDNDVAGIQITDGGSLDVAEGGASDTYEVVLASKPTANVVITIVRGSQLSTGVPSLTFTPDTWNQPQTVTVSAVDDRVAEGSHTAVIGHSVQSGDPAYHGMQVPLRTVKITDNDAAGVIVSASGSTLGVAEGGATATYEVVLASEPTARVTITLGGGDQIALVPTEIVFTATDWNQPRLVTVRALDDSLAEGPHSASIGHMVASTDAKYSGIAAASVAVAIIDNDTAGVLVAQTAGSTDVSEAGTSDIYTLKLTSQPSSNVTIQLQANAQVKT